MDSEYPEIAIALFSVLFFAVTWFFIMSVIFRMSLWTKLADKYGYDGSIKPSRWHGFISGKFGNAKYNNCLCVGVSATGLHVKPSAYLMLGSFQKEFRIPWSAINSIEERKELGRSFLDFHLSDSDLSFSLVNGAYMQEAKLLLSPSTIKLIEKKQQYT